MRARTAMSSATTDGSDQGPSPMRYGRRLTAKRASATVLPAASLRTSTGTTESRVAPFIASLPVTS